jgi:hypothetical protein
MVDITTLSSQKMSVHKLVKQINVSVILLLLFCSIKNHEFQIDERIETRASYRSLMSDLYGELFTRKKIFILIGCRKERYNDLYFPSRQNCLRRMAG